MGKCVFITGASGGIGRACALAFAREGYKIGLGYHSSRESVIELIGRFSREGVYAHAVCGDVSSREDAQRMLDEVQRTLGPVSVLVNNAGIACDAPFTDVTPAMWERVFGVNATGAYNMISAALPGMISAQHGAIVNISSVWGVYGGACEAAYSASKAALIGLTKALARELGPSGIRVNCIAPGVIDTAMNAALTPEDIATLCDKTPLGRTGAPEEVAEAAVFLASANASFITGQILGVDGGFVG